MTIQIPSHSLLHNTKKLGFTIVELLVVIVVLGILATLTIIAYDSVTKQAIETSMESDLKAASSTLEVDRRNHNQYPASGALANEGKGLSVSNQNTITYTKKPYGYCMSITNPSTQTIYRLKNTVNGIETGVCVVTVETVAGSSPSAYLDGPVESAKFTWPTDVAFASDGTAYVTETTGNRIRKITTDGTVSTLAGSVTGAAGFNDATGTAAQFSGPRSLTVDGAGNVYVADYSNNRIRMITPAGAVTTIAGSGVQGTLDGQGTAARLNQPYAITSTSDGTLYVVEKYVNRIRKITPARYVSTIAGQASNGSADGTGTSASFYNPSGIGVDAAGSVIYIADWANNLIRKMTPAGEVTTVAGALTAGFADGNGTAARFNKPIDVAVDDAGNVYISDVNNQRVRMLTPNGDVTSLAGTGAYGFADGVGTVAKFWNLEGIDVNSSGSIYAADGSNYRIRKINP